MRKSRLSRHKQNKLIELFVAGITARTASELVNVNKGRLKKQSTVFSDGLI